MGRAALGAIVACAAQFLIGVDGLAVAIALPALRDDLYGRRRVLTCGMALFAAGALTAAVAPSLAVVVAARAVQGLGAAAAVPAALALIGGLFPEGPARTRAVSV